jgi:hypothetical protein
MRPAIASVAGIASEVSREMDEIERVVKDHLGHAIRNEVRDWIGSASAALDDTCQDHAGSDA